MSEDSAHFSSNGLTLPLLEHLKRHPKRLVFPEGEDIRLLHVAEYLVGQEAVIPILLGRREVIVNMAKEAGICLRFIRIIEPEKSSDFELFCERFTRVEKMKGNDPGNVQEIMKSPFNFASMMALYGQADAVLAGNLHGSAPVFRAVSRYKKEPEQGNPLFAISVVVCEHLKKLGGDGIFFIADAGVSPVPGVSDMAYYAVETGKMARHILGRPVQVSMISASTNGSIPGVPSQRAHAAAVLAQSQLEQLNIGEHITVEGEIQIDAALSPAAYNMRVQHSVLRKPSDVLIFPTLDSADIARKLLAMLPGVSEYGMVIQDILFPIAEVSRLATIDQIYGASLLVANEAIQFHELYPNGQALLY